MNSLLINKKYAINASAVMIYAHYCGMIRLLR